MPNFKCTLFYQLGDYGWSESFWNGSAALGVAFTAAYNLQVKRLATLDTKVYATYLRVAQQGSYRSAYIYDWGGAAAGQGGYVVAEATDVDDSLRVSLQSNLPGGYTHMFMRAIPGINLKDGVYGPEPLWNRAFQAWANTLISPANGWIVNTQAKVRPVGVKSGINIVTPAAQRGFSFTTYGSVVGLTIGSVIRITNFPSTQAEGLNGLKTILAIIPGAVGPPVVPSVIFVGGVVPVISAALANNVGFWYPVNYVQSQITTVMPGPVTSRKAGRVFGVTPGRRRNAIALRR